MLCFYNCIVDETYFNSTDNNIIIYIYVETKYLLLHLNMITPLDKNAKKHKTQKQKGVKNKC